MRTMEHEFLEAIANDPDVRPWMGGDLTKRVELEDIISRPGNYAFVNDEGGFVVHLLAPGLYECHTIFKPGGVDVRGMLRLLWEAQEFMFIETDCDNICTRVASDNPRADALAQHAHFTEQYTRKGMSYRNLSLDAWAEACSTRLLAEGAWFHDRIATAKKAAGVAEPLHDEDPAHDVRVGLSSLMVKAGNVAKGVDIYNRWAVQMGYAPTTVLWGQPVVLHTGDAVVAVRNGGMEILKCL